MATDFEYTFIAAAETGDLEILEEYLSKKIVNIDAGQNQSGCTALMAAAHCNQKKSIDFLIEHGADLNKQDRTGHTALHYATPGQNRDLIRALIIAGIDKDIQNDSGLTASDHALKVLNNVDLASYIENALAIEENKKLQKAKEQIQENFSLNAAQIKTRPQHRTIALKRRQPKR